LSCFNTCYIAHVRETLIKNIIVKK